VRHRRGPNGGGLRDGPVINRPREPASRAVAMPMRGKVSERPAKLRAANERAAMFEPPTGTTPKGRAATFRPPKGAPPNERTPTLVLPKGATPNERTPGLVLPKGATPNDRTPTLVPPNRAGPNELAPPPPKP